MPTASMNGTYVVIGGGGSGGSGGPQVTSSLGGNGQGYTEYLRGWIQGEGSVSWGPIYVYGAGGAGGRVKSRRELSRFQRILLDEL